jgi:hypothetical protein
MAHRDGTAGDALDHGKDLSDGDAAAAARADVVDLVRSWLDRLQRLQMGLGGSAGWVNSRTAEPSPLNRLAATLIFPGWDRTSAMRRKVP